MSAKIMCCDGMNLLHRARSGFTAGDFAVVYNFFRSFRALVELHKPSRIFFVMEGHPKQRYEELPSYKENRVIQGDIKDPVVIAQHEQARKFFCQVDMIIDLMLRHFPVSIVRHPDHEGDDTIYNLIKRSTSAVPWVVISNDSDFTQLLDEFDNVSVYNPMAKSFVEKHESDYVSWKALRGDASDNIKGIVSDAKATFLMDEPEELEKFFNDPTNSQRFTENHKLIKFITWSEDEAVLMQSSASPARDWDAVMNVFDTYGFKSMTNEKAKSKFVDTFDHLFGE